MKDITFGQYYPSNSFIHRMDARAKLLITIIYMVSIFLVSSYTAYAFVVVCFLTVVFVSKVPLKTVLRSIKAILVLLIITAIINLLFYREGNELVSFWIIKITDEGVDFTIKMMLRLSLLVAGSAVLPFTTTPTQLTDAIESLLSPLKYIKVPVHDIAIVMSITLRFIPGLMEETDKIMMAQKARGASLDSGNIFKRVKAMIPILIPLFISAFRRADELADALDARCYNATPNRTKMKVFKFGLRDIIGLLAGGIFITLICLDAYLIDGQGFLKGMDNYIWNYIKGLVG